MMKVRVLLLLVVAFSGLYVSAEDAKLKCSVSGIIRDSDTDESLPFASVQIYRVSDNIYVAGAITDINGNFKIENISPEAYRFSVSFMGYDNLEKIIPLKKRNHREDFKLSRKKFSLAEVQITSDKKLVENTISKTTVNVSKSTINKIGTAKDVIQTLPSVDVDYNGNINYRGSDKVIILINGNKSELVNALDQIPASQVEKIELVNNPSAKYDAEGMSGVINVVLKSEKIDNTKTTLMLVAGLPETYGGNAGFSGNTGRASYYVNAGYNHNTKFQTKEHLRQNVDKPGADNYYQYDRMDEILNKVFFNTSVDYQFNKKHKIGIAAIGSSADNSADRYINYRTLNQKGDTVFSSRKDIDIKLNNASLDGNLSYRYKPTKNNTLDANVHYSFLDQQRKMNNRYYTENTFQIPELQNTVLQQINNIVDADVDFIHRINDSIKLDAGYSFSNKDLVNEFESISYNYNSQDWEDDTLLNNSFNYNQQISAAYVSFNAQLRSIEIVAGIRSEYTSTSQNDTNSSNYLEFFPTVTVSMAMGKKVVPYLSYSRRINRPTLRMLNPYTDEYADILNMHVGNPNLLPEFVNSYEMGCRFIGGMLSVTGSVFYRKINQAISRIKFATNDSALLVTYINLNNAELFGGELSLSGKPYSWWTFNASWNIFHTAMNGEYGNNIIKKRSTGWIASMNNTFKLPAKINLQVIGYYRSKLPDVTGTYIEKYYVDLALSKKVMNNKGRVVFKVSDLFNTYSYGLDLYGYDSNGYQYTQSNRRKNESQYFTLSFIYNIKSKEKKTKKEKFYLDSYGK